MSLGVTTFILLVCSITIFYVNVGAKKKEDGFLALNESNSSLWDTAEKLAKDTLEKYSKEEGKPYMFVKLKRARMKRTKKCKVIYKIRFIAKEGKKCRKTRDEVQEFLCIFRIVMAKKNEKPTQHGSCEPIEEEEGSVFDDLYSLWEQLFS